MRPHGAIARWFRPLACGILLWCSPLVASDGAPTVAEVFQRFADAVVRVSIITEDPTGRNIPEKFYASGFFIDNEGRLLTKVSKSRNVARAWVEKDGLVFAAELIGTDPRTELGLFQVSRIPAHATAIPVEVRPARLPPGSPIVAIARPLELKASPSAGIVTAHESTFSRDTVFPCTYTRTNIQFGFGEHGGPVLDLEGRLVGIAVVNVPNLNASYLVPTNAIARVVPELIKHARVDYATVRMEFGEEPDALNRELQVKVTAVEPDSPAARAGLRPGDVVRRLGDTPIHGIDDLRDVLFFARPEDRFITMVVEREERQQTTFTLPLDRLTEESGPQNLPSTSSTPEPAVPSVPAGPG